MEETSPPPGGAFLKRYSDSHSSIVYSVKKEGIKDANAVGKNHDDVLEDLLGQIGKYEEIQQNTELDQNKLNEVFNKTMASNERAIKNLIEIQTGFSKNTKDCILIIAHKLLVINYESYFMGHQFCRKLVILQKASFEKVREEIIEEAGKVEVKLSEKYERLRKLSDDLHSENAKVGLILVWSLHRLVLERCGARELAIVF